MYGNKRTLLDCTEWNNAIGMQWKESPRPAAPRRVSRRGPSAHRHYQVLPFILYTLGLHDRS